MTSCHGDGIRCCSRKSGPLPEAGTIEIDWRHADAARGSQTASLENPGCPTGGVSTIGMDQPSDCRGADQGPGFT